MRKVIGMLALVVGLAVVGTSVDSQVDAQDKAKTKLKDKKDSAAAVGTVEIYKAKDGYRFRIKDAEGKTIAMPPRGHESKDDVVKDLEEIKATLNKAKPTEIKE